MAKPCWRRQGWPRTRPCTTRWRPTSMRCRRGRCRAPQPSSRPGGATCRPADPVEGDADVGHATSLLDYVFRHLAVNYLGGCNVPEGIPEAEPDKLPLLPLDLPTQPRARRPGLRLVSNG